MTPIAREYTYPKVMELPTRERRQRELGGVAGLVRGAGALRLQGEPDPEGRPPAKKMKMSKSNTMVVDR